jgi:hypothetical protein
LEPHRKTLKRHQLRLMLKPYKMLKYYLAMKTKKMLKKKPLYR